jgi:hypothetical protein
MGPWEGLEGLEWFGMVGMAMLAKVAWAKKLWNVEGEIQRNVTIPEVRNTKHFVESW